MRDPQAVWGFGRGLPPHQVGRLSGSAISWTVVLRSDSRRVSWSECFQTVRPAAGAQERDPPAAETVSDRPKKPVCVPAPRRRADEQQLGARPAKQRHPRQGHRRPSLHGRRPVASDRRHHPPHRSEASPECLRTALRYRRPLTPRGGRPASLSSCGRTMQVERAGGPPTPRAFEQASGVGHCGTHTCIPSTRALTARWMVSGRWHASVPHRSMIRIETPPHWQSDRGSRTLRLMASARLDATCTMGGLQQQPFVGGW